MRSACRPRSIDGIEDVLHRAAIAKIDGYRKPGTQSNLDELLQEGRTIQLIAISLTCDTQLGHTSAIHVLDSQVTAALGQIVKNQPIYYARSDPPLKGCSQH